MESEGMKPRSLFDNPDAWVASEFKRPPRPVSIVTLPNPEPKPAEEKIVPPAVPFPPSALAMPYQTGFSPVVRQTIQAVASMAGIPMAHIVSDIRTLEVVIVRQVAIWIARRFTNRSLKVIGSEVGGRDHTTVLHSIQRINKLISERNLVPEEDTPEAWTRLLLFHHAAEEKGRVRAYARRQSEHKRARALRLKAEGKPLRVQKTGQ
jgi:hypothetical protein